MDDQDADLWTHAGRMDSFKKPFPGQNGPKKVAWPRKKPTPKQLAAAGFYYRPGPDSIDNCACFHCGSNLDNWDDDDDPVEEHFRHRPSCSLAILLKQASARSELPSDEALLAARIRVFADRWPHEGKDGWKCNVANMAAAGWCYTPQRGAPDAVTCYYCDAGVAEFEEQDDPYLEHYKRKPNCAFFSSSLGEIQSSKPKARKGGRPKAARPSQTSRLSTQSNQSTFSEAPSFMSLGGDTSHIADFDVSIAPVDDSSATVTKSTSRKTTAKRVPLKAQTRARKTARDANAEPSGMDTTLDVSINPAADMSRLHPLVEPSAFADTVLEGTVLEPDRIDVVGTKVSKKKGDRAVRTKLKAKTQTKQPIDDESLAQSDVMHSALEERIRSPSPPKQASIREETPHEIDPAPTTEGNRPKRSPKPTMRQLSATAQPSRKRKSDSTEASVHASADEPRSPARPIRNKRSKNQANTSQFEASEIIASTTLPLEASSATRAAPVVRMRASPARPTTIPEAESPQCSDAENRPPNLYSSTRSAPSGTTQAKQVSLSETMEKADTTRQMSPTRTVRIPITTASTPERAPQNVGRLHSTVPWTPTDINLALQISPSQSGSDSPFNMHRQLTAAELSMTMTEFIKFHAAEVSDKFRRECEKMVTAFEQEGARAQQVIESIQVKLSGTYSMRV